MVTTRERILIADDEEILRTVLNRKLSKEGYRCKEAGNVEQAINELKLDPSELLILDINMPGKPGNEALPEIKAAFPETAVIMASAVTELNVIVQCIKDGAQDYLRKPFSLSEVLLSVGQALEKRKLEALISEHLPRLQTEGQTTETRRLFINTIEALVSGLEANDKYTAGHSRRVTQIALALGKQLGLPDPELDDLRWGALLHDVGKIAVDTSILNKPGKLTDEEYRHIMAHAIIGPRIVKPVANQRVVDIISHHHDHYDGSGLNQTIAGEAIPLGARILAVADAFDAMVSDRPYRSALPCEKALAEIRQCQGSQFDPVIATAFLQMPVPAPVLAQA